ncbi:leucyl aminopeptidase [Agromyces sp. NPDC049794]|uniref:leucyl aminopeptidase n=1 Tax=unclassified Agromyces TaxID=2639701 RepID=UPI0033DAF4B5
MSTSSAVSQRADALVIGVVKGPEGPLLVPGAETVVEAFDGALVEILGRLGVTGAEGEVVKLPSPSGVQPGVVLAVGLGAAYDAEKLREATGVAARNLAGMGNVSLALPVETAEAAEAVALGGLLGAYTFTAYRAPGNTKPPVGELTILTRDRSQTSTEVAAQRATVIGRELNRCRDLVNMPANDLSPERFAAAVRAAGEEYRLEVEVLDEKALAAGSFGGILGVGQGSASPPRLVRIGYRHPDAQTSLAFVGKGITYDSGGISLKPVGSNEIMKRDMAGAGAVFAAVAAISQLGLRIEVDGWLALAENMPSGSAIRPGDVLRMYGGKTVEVLNTDAEGRLVLADALVRASEEKPDAIVDVATLTAATRMALGNRIFGVMSNNDEFRDRILDAAKQAGEQAWPLPLPAHLRTGLASRVADIANTGERMGGGLVAGLFLKEFVPDDIDWAHLDIAGPAYHEGEPYGYTPAGGTGSAVRTLVRLAQDAAGLRNETRAC